MRWSRCLLAVGLVAGCTEHGHTPYRFHASIEPGGAVVTAGGVQLHEVEGTYSTVEDAREQFRVEFHIVSGGQSNDVVLVPGFCDEAHVGELKLEDVIVVVTPQLTLQSRAVHCVGTAGESGQPPL